MVPWRLISAARRGESARHCDDDSWWSVPVQYVTYESACVVSETVHVRSLLSK